MLKLIWQMSLAASVMYVGVAATQAAETTPLGFVALLNFLALLALLALGVALFNDLGDADKGDCTPQTGSATHHYHRWH